MSAKNKLMEILLAATPISHRILMAAWNDLSFETQCDLLLNYNSCKGIRLDNQWERDR